MTSIMIALIAVLTAFELSGVSIGQIEGKLSQLPNACKEIVQSGGHKTGGDQAVANPLLTKHEDEKLISAAEIVRVACENCTAAEELNNYYKDLR